MTTKTEPFNNQILPSRRDLLKSMLLWGSFAGLPQGWAAEGTSQGMWHWPLERDLSELIEKLKSESPAMGIPFARKEGRSCLNLDGRHHGIKYPASESLQKVGKGEFSCAAWISSDVNDANPIGDILTKYDAERRQGFQLSVVTNAGVTNGQSNLKQIQFGVDAGTDPVIQDCGRPGHSMYAFSLISFRGNLYCATCESGEKDAGHVYRYGGGQTWHDCGAPDRCNAVSAMAEFNGELYVGTARYNLKGSALEASPNLNPGGKIFRYLGDSRWEDCGKIGESAAVYGLIVYDDKLYASSLYAPAGVFRYEGGQKWVFCGTAPEGKRIEALTVFRGALYGSAFDHGGVFRYSGGTEWKTVGVIPETSQTYGFSVHGGELYVSTWPTAIVYRYVKDGDWAPCGRMAQELESMPLAHYNGKMYTGTLPSGEVYRFDGGTKWAKIAQVDPTPDVKYRRAWSMAVHQGKLYCGTLPSGKVSSIEAGGCVTCDQPLPTGWQHVAAVRDSKSLRLYLNGKRVAEQPLNEKLAQADFSSQAALIIGAGNHAPLRAGLRDVQLFSKGLSDDEIAGLFRESPR